MTICDFYNPLKHTEISIKRARKAFPPNSHTVQVSTDRLPFKDHTFDYALAILSAHEIRDERERVLFFSELSRVTKPTGLIFVTEHLRDFNNFIAYSLGFFHFHSKTSWLTTKLHFQYISKFNACWVPDVSGVQNLSGVLGHPEKVLDKIKYIGPLSRIEKKSLPIKYDIMVLLSGPEPQRTLLEKKLSKELEKSTKEILFVKGVVESQQEIEKTNSITYYNFMNSEQLNTAFNESEVVVCRSGYTTVMDLAKLEKKAFFIPTPGQYEQEYLAKKFKSEIIAPSCKQEKFKASKLEKIHFYKGFNDYSVETNWNELFSLFQSK